MAFVFSGLTVSCRPSRKRVCFSTAFPSTQPNTACGNRRARFTMAESEAAVVKTASGMKKIPQADEATIEKIGCRGWGTWECGISKFPWTYSADEVCLVLEGEFTVKADGSDDTMHVVAGDIAFFPKGMSCVWDVTKAVRKYYMLGIQI